MKLLPRLAVAVVSLSVAACSGGTATDTPPADVTVVTAPAEVEVRPGALVQFSANVTGAADKTVTWSVEEADGGTITATGLYTAPAGEGTFHVRADHGTASGSGATSTALRVAGPDSTSVKKNANGRSTVKVSSTAAQTLTVSITPSTATLDACGRQQFAATVTGVTDTRVTWSVAQAGGGTVSSGLYTAPQATGTFVVVATSVADPSKVAQATVTVGPEKVLGVAVTPGSGTVQPSGALTFAALVSTTCGTYAAQ